MPYNFDPQEMADARIAAAEWERDHGETELSTWDFDRYEEMIYGE